MHFMTGAAPEFTVPGCHSSGRPYVQHPLEGNPALGHGSSSLFPARDGEYAAHDPSAVLHHLQTQPPDLTLQLFFLNRSFQEPPGTVGLVSNVLTAVLEMKPERSHQDGALSY